MSALRKAGDLVVKQESVLTVFQKIKVQVSLAKKYNGDARKIPQKTLQAMYRQDPKKITKKLNESLGLNFETLEQKNVKNVKKRPRRNRQNQEEDDNDVYQLKTLKEQRQAICTDAETGEVIKIKDVLEYGEANAGRRMDN